MNELSPELTRKILQPAMHEKLLLRAAELVAIGWTRGTAARVRVRRKPSAFQRVGRLVPGSWSLQTWRKIASTLCFEKYPVLFQLSQRLRENFFGSLFIASPRPYGQLGQVVSAPATA